MTVLVLGTVAVLGRPGGQKLPAPHADQPTAGRDSIESSLSDFLRGQVLGQLSGSRRLFSAAAARTLHKPFLRARAPAKHHTCCPIFISLMYRCGN